MATPYTFIYDVLKYTNHNLKSFRLRSNDLIASAIRWNTFAPNNLDKQHQNMTATHFLLNASLKVVAWSKLYNYSSWIFQMMH